MDERDAFEQIVANEAAAESATDRIASARAVLAGLLEDNDGQLSRWRAQEIARTAGRDVRTVRRWQQEWVAERSVELAAPAAPTGGPDEPDGDEVTALERLLTVGTEAFAYDRNMLVLLTLVGGNHSELRRLLIAAGYPMPSLPTMSRRWAHVSAMQRSGVKFGVRFRASKLLHIRHTADAPNEVWEFDPFNLDVFVRTPNGTTPIRPWLLLLIDDRSRFVVSWALIPRNMRSADVLAALGAGFEVRPADNGTGVLIGGWPDTLTCDNDQAIVSEVVREAFDQLPTSVTLAPAYTPTRKGKVERAGQTIQRSVIAGLPGQVTRGERLNGSHTLVVDSDSLLSFEHLEQRVAEVIHGYNYERAHGSLGGKTPFDVYTTGWTARHLSDEELGSLMMPVPRDDGRRKVHHDGLHVFGTYYVDVALAPLLGRTGVQIRSWHHRHQRVAVYDDGEFVGMVPHTGLLTEEQRRAVMQHRIDEMRAVNSTAKQAREALATIGATVARGGAVDSVGAVMGPGNSEPVPAADVEPAPVAARPQPAAKRPPANRKQRAATATAQRSRPDDRAARARRAAEAVLEDDQ